MRTGGERRRKACRQPDDARRLESPKSLSLGMSAFAREKGKRPMCFRPAAASTPKTCPACGMINPAVAEKCVNCGAELPEDRIKCPHCGEMNIKDATECSECGTSLVGVEGAAPAPGAPAAPAPATPGAPAAPGAPGAPSAPKPPVA